MVGGVDREYHSSFPKIHFLSFRFFITRLQIDIFVPVSLDVGECKSYVIKREAKPIGGGRVWMKGIFAPVLWF